MTTERTPRPGTKMELVLPYLIRNESIREITMQTGLSPQEISAIKYESRGRYLPKATQKDREKDELDRRRAISIGMGGQAVTVEAFARMQMIPMEAREALLQTTGKNLTIYEARMALRGARAIIGRRRTKSERLELIAEKRLSQKDLQERVRLWLDVQTLLVEAGVSETEMPKERKDWLLLIAWLRANRQKIIGNQQPLWEIKQKMDVISTAQVRRLQPCIDAISDQDPERALIEMAREGNRIAFDHLYIEHAQYAYTYALRMVKKPVVAEDIVSQAFLRAYRGIKKYRFMSRDYRKFFRAWIKRIIKNVVYDEARRKENKNISLEASAERTEYRIGIQYVDAQISDPDTRIDLQNVVNNLPELQRKVITLRFQEGYSEEETAQILEIPIDMVMEIQNQTRQVLRELIYE